MRVKKLIEKIILPEKVQVTLENGVAKVKGPKGELERQFKYRHVDITQEGNKIILSVKDANKKDKMQLGTVASHITNMVKGVSEGHLYRLKICSGHFPMTVAITGKQFQIKNFLGEKVPRTIELKEGATVKVEGNEITVESTDIEKAGQIAADIEQLSRITNRDIRIFQDGIYITKKAKRTLE
jgi:large subunit ribosomal protein L6